MKLITFCVLLIFASLPNIVIADCEKKLTHKEMAHLQRLAKRGDTESQIDLGTRYLYACGVSLDIKKAIVFYKSAATKGSAKAQYNLANLYAVGLGTDKDLDQAKILYLAAAENKYSQAYFALGNILFEESLESKEKICKALVYFQKAEQDKVVGAKEMILRVQEKFPALICSEKG